VLRADFHRPGGPRGARDKADADLEAERLIRGRLHAFDASWRYLGEETGAGEGAPGSPVWLVDPNDGTRDYLVGRRGSAVSIGLAHEGRPRLGVVYAFAHPDDRGELFAWAEGCGSLRHDEVAVEVALPAALGRSDVALVSSRADRDPEASLLAVEPARYRTTPSIAYRLAATAAGQAAAATSLYAPGAWDYAAGHALLRAVGGALVDERGREVGYDDQGGSSTRRAFGGSPLVVADLAARRWEGAQESDGSSAWRVRLRPGEAVSDPARLSRAHGCLLALIAADSSGGWEPERDLQDDPGGGRLAGQPRAAGEMAIALARSIVAESGFDRAAALAAYREWAASEPPARPGADAVLARAAVLGVFAHALPGPEAAELARADATLTGSDAATAASAAERAAAIARAVGGVEAPGPVTTGALFGATQGRGAVPAQWRRMVLSCRPHPLRTSRPRPRACWPVDLMEIAERLLLAGESATD